MKRMKADLDRRSTESTSTDLKGDMLEDELDKSGVSFALGLIPHVEIDGENDIETKATVKDQGDCCFHVSMETCGGPPSEHTRVFRDPKIDVLVEQIQ